MRSTRSTAAVGPAPDAAARRLALLAADLAAERRSSPTAHPDETDDLDDPDVAEVHGSAGGGTVLAGPWWADHTRVSARGAAADEDLAVSDAPVPTVGRSVAPDAGPPSLPVPGRHAARRRRPALSSRISLPALTWGPAHLAVVALVVAVGLAVGTWWITRDRSGPVAPVAVSDAPALVDTTGDLAAPDSAAATGTAAPGASGAAGATGQVTVDVTGKVRRPGIVVLDAGARVVDAVEAAGGARPGVDLSSINLARVLTDGEQIVVGLPGGVAAAPGPSTGGSAAPGAPTALVNLNLAGPEELEALPEVGPVTAGAIVTWREEHGGFTSVDELLEVDGIGEKTLESIRPHVTL